jgi:cellulose synthase/poly-beta-1,6-N-acetylglucosamine synthase-like glycosyltransferase
MFVIIIGLLIYLAASIIYQLVLAAAYFVVPERKQLLPDKHNRFAILVPAHNEELLISRLCESLLKIRYPRDKFIIYIIADNCTDETAVISSRYPVRVMTRDDTSHTGKGHAINWALSQVRLGDFDAVLIVDADNIVDPNILEELNSKIDSGEQAIQCNNAVGNRGDSWFTQLLFVSRTVGNLLYHHAKYKLGLSSYLMGNGICFSTKLLARKKWTAFSVGEDWEYYAQLIQDRIKVGYAVKAKVFHQESRSLKQATTQRLRWSSGRFHVLRKYGIGLFKDGITKRDLFTLDASLPLIFPNYSLQINLTFLYLILSIAFTASYFRRVLLGIGLFLVIGQIALFMAGIYLSKSYKEVFKAILRAPFFLIWKAVIDLLSFTGSYREKKWIRTQRHISNDKLKSNNG